MSIDLSNVPNKSGVYIWKNKLGKVIYIGKSKNLHKTMEQYFKGNLTTINKSLIENIDSFEFEVIEEQSEIIKREQLLIDEYDPIFNIKLRTAKLYPYIEIKKGNKFRVIISKHKKDDKAKYYGPFRMTSTARDILKLLVETLEYDESLSSKEQDIFIERVEDFFKGKLDYIESKITNDEQRETISLFKKEVVKVYDDDRNVDIIGYHLLDGLVSISVTVIRNGYKFLTATFINKLFSPYKEDGLQAFISRLYSSNVQPDYLVLPHKLEWDVAYNVEVIYEGYDNKTKELLNETTLNSESKLTSNVYTNIGKIKDYAKALDFIRKTTEHKSKSNLIEELTLHDINGSKFVTVVQFLNGISRPSGYRKYIIRPEDTIIDAVELHFKTIKEKKKSAPDIFIINGKDQLEMLKPYKNESKHTSVISINKNENGVIVSVSNELVDEYEIEFNSHIYLLLTRIDKESIKHYNSYHLSGTHKVILESKLDIYPFLNEVDKQILFKKFKSLKRIKDASLEELGNFLQRGKAKKLYESIKR